MARSGAGGGGSRGGGGGSRGGGGFKSGGGSRSGGSFGGAGRSGAGRSGASGGAGRGFGSSFGSSGPSRSGASGGPRPGGFGGGPVPPRGGGYRPPPPPPRYGFFRHRPRPYYGGGWRSWTPWGGYGYRRGCGCGGSVMALLIVLLLVLGSLGSCSALSFLPWYGYGSGYGYYDSYGYDDYYYYQGTGYDSTSGIPKSTLNRTPLPAGSVVETEYYTDEMDWIHNNQTLTSGMREFYDKTGVQPYLYIAAQVGGTSEPGEAQIRDFTVDRYDELFVDEAHLLLVFVDGDYDYTAQLVCGSDAVSVIDGQAMDILLAYLDQYYYDGSLGDEEYFSLVFSKTANDIMKTQMSPWLVVTIVGAVVFLVGLLVAVLVSRSKKSRGNP